MQAVASCPQTFQSPESHEESKAQAHPSRQTKRGSAKKGAGQAREMVVHGQKESKDIKARKKSQNSKECRSAKSKTQHTEQASPTLAG